MLTSARKWRGRHTAARRRCRFSPGPSASAVVVAFRHRFLRSCSRFPLAAHFFLAFFSACASSPRIAPVLGERDRCGHQGKSPADLMAATDFETRPAFFKAAKSIFLSLILFGEDVRLHYL
ncbi:hypothetical protein AMC90_CH00892 [Rhizobium phaseoli]|uniref:Uncharacterized protein n=2 Tax=Rhizobium TaxID=379 RepID=B3PRF0_RHIE6|nr:hypothetical protein RHECIAT_CH0000948 [Rhizobium etli CIAT 652]ANL26760.1 hypothetical protein AMC90_CH00892 [Rhizobium phaseoli]ANL39356.1 hypothetical protein AMC88_CH00926 [Rhizobium phaseoli]ANL52089.1 hypothetical protein AMC86_CH00906 [Rhizobium phaseoli]ANL58345.1 hypothetical protein AMC85_CH00926 [Rhizobium phaseoli]